jgi:hypothetical protein
MSHLRTTVHWDTQTAAYVKADIVHTGSDGVDTYRWEWGLDHGGVYQPMDAGEVQHRSDVDGSFSLLGKILIKIGIPL